MARMTLAKLDEEFRALRAEVDGHLIDVATELAEMARKVERSDLVCTRLANQIAALELRRRRGRGK